MKTLFLSAFLLCFLSFASCAIRFDNDPLLRVSLNSPSQVTQLSSWIDSINFLYPHLDTPPLDVWSHDCTIISGPNDIHVNQSFLPQFQSIMNDLSISYTVTHSNIQELIDNQTKPTGALDWFDEYHTYEGIVNEVERLCESKPSLCTYDPQVASSIQGRSIVAVHLQGESSNPNAPIIWIQGGQHAREWVGPATVMFLLNQFITNYGVDPVITAILDKTHVIIIPVVNPDGYDYSWTNNRLWRKNRRNNGGNVYGVDLNRNWADHWGGPGSSGVPSSDTYRGTAAFSEPETRGVSQYMLSYASQAVIIIGIDYHSYSQLVLRPFSWGTTQPPLEPVLRAGGDGYANAIRATPNGAVYVSQAGWELYIASGGAHDWFYTYGGAELSYTVELRDTGYYGFELPPNLIGITALENWNGLKWLINYALN